MVGARALRLALALLAPVSLAACGGGGAGLPAAPPPPAVPPAVELISVSPRSLMPGHAAEVTYAVREDGWRPQTALVLDGDGDVTTVGDRVVLRPAEPDMLGLVRVVGVAWTRDLARPAPWRLLAISSGDARPEGVVDFGELAFVPDLRFGVTTGGDDARIVDVDAAPDGGAYVIGTFTGALVLGEGTPSAVNLTAAGAGDGFLARYGPSGELRWARAFAGPSVEGMADVEARAGGGCVVLAGFTGSLSLDGGGAPSRTLTSYDAGAADVAIACYDAEGALRWSRVEGGTAAEEPVGVAESGGGGLVVVVRFTGATIVGRPGPFVWELTSTGPAAFLEMLDETGEIVTVQTIRGTGELTLVPPATAPGGFVLAGRFGGTVTLPADAGQVVSLRRDAPTPWIPAIFYARFGRFATASSARQDAGLDVIHVTGSAVRDDGTVLLAGVGLDATLGIDEENAIALPVGDGGMNGWLACYGPDDRFLWATGARMSAGDVLGCGVSVAPDGSAIFGGQGNGAGWTFGRGGADDATRTVPSATSGFVTRIGSDGALREARVLAGTGRTTFRALSAAGDGGVLLAGDYAEGTLDVFVDSLAPVRLPVPAAPRGFLVRAELVGGD